MNRVLFAVLLLVYVAACASDAKGSPDASHGHDTGIPFEEMDSDGDGIDDASEGRAAEVDTDDDGSPDYLDEDSDGDGVPDHVEGADDLDLDGVPSFRDLDTDGDRLPDRLEDLDGDGELDPDETSRVSPNTDGDGTSDLVEVALGSDPRSSLEDPVAEGVVPVVAPHDAPPVADALVIEAAPRLRKLDVYLLVDRSDSMAAEVGALKEDFASVVSAQGCPESGGTGTPGSCIDEIWSGAGSIGFAGQGAESYAHHLDVQPDHSLVGPAIPTGQPAGCCEEAHLLGLWSTFTGGGSEASGCTLEGSHLPRADCAGSPAGEAGKGYPCFREDAVPVVVLATDEAPSASFTCPSVAQVTTAAWSLGGKIIGVLWQGSSFSTRTDLQELATTTDTIDSQGSPLVIDGDDPSFVTRLGDALATLAFAGGLRARLALVDDPSDAVDVATLFGAVEVHLSGTEACSAEVTTEDVDGDDEHDGFVGLSAGTPVCWRVAVERNDAIAPGDAPQAFTATALVRNPFGHLLDAKRIAVVVPPLP